MRAAALAAVLSLSSFLAGETIYLSDSSGAILAYDPATQALTLVADTGRPWFDIALSPAGVLFASDSYSLYRLDLATGSATEVGGFGVFINALTFSGSTLYAAGFDTLYTIDLLTGEALGVGSTGFSSSGDLAVMDADLYLTATGAAGDLLVQLDPLIGKPSVVGPIGFQGVMGLAGTSSGLWGFTGSGEIVLIDPATGAGSSAGSLGPRIIYGATAPPSSVPEPAVLLLFGTGLLTMARCRLHR